MTKLQFTKYFFITVFYISLIAVILPWLVSAKSTVAFGIAGLLVGVFFIMVPAFLIINKLNAQKSSS